MSKTKQVIFLLVFFLLITLIFLVVMRLNTNQTNNNPQSIIQNIAEEMVQQDIEVIGWIASWDLTANRSAIYTMDFLNSFSPMLYQVSPNSGLEKISNVNRDYLIELARQKDLPIIPVITDGSDPVRINRLLYEDERREKFINQLIAEAETKNFSGWSIDIESLEGKDKAAFTEFVKAVSEAVHQNNLKLNVIVYGRDESETYDPALAHNYQDLAQFADQIQLMVYNYNNELTPPGGQSPLSWYRNVLEYATQTIPKDKILIGLSANGFDWGPTGKAKGLTYNDVHKLLNNKQSDVIYNVSESSAIVNYNQNKNPHQIWFEDASTIFEKIQIARNEFGVNKFALWWIGAEDPQIWEKIEELTNQD